jgi:N6-adenosine-specific RNA methylase IME4
MMAITDPETGRRRIVRAARSFIDHDMTSDQQRTIAVSRRLGGHACSQAGADVTREAVPFAELPRHQAGVILADPPWHFSTCSPKGWKKSAHAKYPCMELADIAILPVSAWADPAGCLLILWATQAQLPVAPTVMERWGFTYKTISARAKQSKTGTCWAFGTGFLLRSAAEFFLLGTRGHVSQRSRSARNLIVAPVREHSRKPDETYSLIETT